MDRHGCNEWRCRDLEQFAGKNCAKTSGTLHILAVRCSLSDTRVSVGHQRSQTHGQSHSVASESRSHTTVRITRRHDEILGHSRSEWSSFDFRWPCRRRARRAVQVKLCGNLIQYLFSCHAYQYALFFLVRFTPITLWLHLTAALFKFGTFVAPQRTSAKSLHIADRVWLSTGIRSTAIGSHRAAATWRCAYGI